MKLSNFTKTAIGFGLMAVLAAVPTALFGQNNADGNGIAQNLRVSGSIVTLQGENPGFSMDIKGFTSDKEVKDELKALESKGQDGFLKAIEKQNLGYFALEGSVGQDLKYVRRSKTVSGTKIVAVFERWMEPFEYRYGSVSMDYPFTYIELFLDENGNGSGTIIGAAKVAIDKNDPTSIDFDNFGSYPAKLIGIHISK